ncbi:MAG: hypothetical protein DHS20C20_04370 [Ardenticatenaceae bacterium]|nr:MAG: hypothetical protein DHS20C20_04370 [Ardenticatenaceae bacterium]
MSKYEELMQSYSFARKAFRDYEETCRNFARDLVFGMVEYFEWPQEREITYIPVGEDLDPNNKFYALAGAMRMDAESFWHFGVELNLMEASGAYPLSIVLSFFIKKAGSNFIVKLGPNGREIKIPEDKRGELEPFFEAVFRQIKEFLTKRYVLALAGQEKEYGFITLI